jgi:plastocyanin
MPTFTRPFVRMLALLLLAALLAGCGGTETTSAPHDGDDHMAATADPTDDPTTAPTPAPTGDASSAEQADPDEADGMAHGADDMPHGGDDAGHGPSTTVDPVPGAREVTVSAVELAFEPAALTVDAGEAVNLTVRNDGALFHDWTLDEAGLHLNVDPGEEVTTALALDTPGTYAAVCTVRGHAEAGMVMTVIVR